jgi:uracil-DNA glycosylase
MSTVIISEIKNNMHESWNKFLEKEFGKSYFLNLSQFLHDEILAGQIIFPDSKSILSAMDYVSFEGVQVVIL